MSDHWVNCAFVLVLEIVAMLEGVGRVIQHVEREALETEA